MSYTIISAQWGNAAQDAAVVATTEVGAVAISARDTPAEWVAFNAWAAKNSVAPASPGPVAPTKQQRFDKFMAGLGVTPAEFKLMLG